MVIAIALVENWLRVARMSKDGVITALEQGFKLWEREIRRTVSSAKRRGASRVGQPDGRVDGKLAQGDRGFQQVITGEARSPLGSQYGPGVYRSWLESPLVISLLMFLCISCMVPCK